MLLPLSRNQRLSRLVHSVKAHRYLPSHRGKTSRCPRGPKSRPSGRVAWRRWSAVAPDESRSGVSVNVERDGRSHNRCRIRSRTGRCIQQQGRRVADAAAAAGRRRFRPSDRRGRGALPPTHRHGLCARRSSRHDSTGASRVFLEERLALTCTAYRNARC